jgi:hypothetical protein
MKFKTSFSILLWCWVDSFVNGEHFSPKSDVQAFGRLFTRLHELTHELKHGKNIPPT